MQSTRKLAGGWLRSLNRRFSVPSITPNASDEVSRSSSKCMFPWYKSRVAVRCLLGRSRRCHIHHHHRRRRHRRARRLPQLVSQRRKRAAYQQPAAFKPCTTFLKAPALRLVASCLAKFPGSEGDPLFAYQTAQAMHPTASGKAVPESQY